MLFETSVAVLLVVGAGFTFVGSLGLATLQDLFMRLHGPTKATTLGVGCILVAAVIGSWQYNGQMGLRELLISFFLFITAPVSAHMIAKAALHIGVSRHTPGRPPDEPANG